MSAASSPDRPLVLVTGAAGKIGRYVVSDLCASGRYRVRALTSNATRDLGAEAERPVEWRHHDWLQTVDFREHVAGCDAVIHLGAETWRIDRMQRVNVEATRSLATAAERAGVASFVFVSSIAAYGSSRDAIVTEEAPLMTPDRDVRRECRGNASFRAYGRSKVQGEMDVAAASRTMRYTIARPTVVVDIEDLIERTRDGAIMKSIGARRLTNFVFIRDVAAALAWLMEQNLSHGHPSEGQAFNISDGSSGDGTYGDFYARMEDLSGTSGLRARVDCPVALYNIADMLAKRSVSLRRPLGMMAFPSTRIQALGFTHPFGMEAAMEQAALRLRG